MTTAQLARRDALQQALDHRPGRGCGSRPISAPRNTPVSDAFFSISGQTSGGAVSRPARPTQLIRPR